MKFERAFIIFGAILLPVLLFFLEPLWTSYFKEVKSLEYTFLSSSKLIRFKDNKNNWNELKIQYGKDNLEDATTITVRIKNNGTIPIEKKDFEEPISINLSDKSDIKAFKQLPSYPKNIEIIAKISNNKLKIEPLLVNPGDEIYVELLASGDVSPSSVTSRITGVKEISERELERKEGVYIHYVTPLEEMGSSKHQPIIKVPSNLSLFLTSIAIFLSLAAFLASSRARRTYMKLLYLASSLSHYLIGGFFAMLWRSTATVDTSTVNITLLFASVLIASGLAFLIDTKMKSL